MISSPAKASIVFWLSLVLFFLPGKGIPGTYDYELCDKTAQVLCATENDYLGPGWCTEPQYSCHPIDEDYDVPGLHMWSTHESEASKWEIEAMWWKTDEAAAQWWAKAELNKYHDYSNNVLLHFKTNEPFHGHPGTKHVEGFKTAANWAEATFWWRMGRVIYKAHFEYSNLTAPAAENQVNSLREILYKNATLLSGWATIAGFVTDGFGDSVTKQKHPLVHVPVTICWDGNETLPVYTDDSGKFSISHPSFAIGGYKEYWLKVCLIDKDNTIKVIDPEALLGECHETNRFKLDQSEINSAGLIDSIDDETHIVTLKAVNFSSIDFFRRPNMDTQYFWRMDNNALIYYYTYRAVDFARNTLGLKLDFSLPLKIESYTGTAAGWSGNVMYEDFWVVEQDTMITISGEYSEGNPEKPVNCEWHEFAHHIMADTFDNYMPKYRGDTNHAGYDNNSTSDSWTEGFAEFVSLLIQKHEEEQKRETKSTPWTVYTHFGNLEDNVKCWDKEEAAIVGILIDLHDGKNPLEHDYVTLSLPEIWNKLSGWKKSKFGTGHIFDLKDLYDAFSEYVAEGKYSQFELDEIFKIHGAFADDNCTHKYVLGEDVGRAAGCINWKDKSTNRPDRRNTPKKEGSYILFEGKDSGGAQIDPDRFTIKVKYAPPYSFYDYQYTTTRSFPNKLYFQLLQTDLPRTAYITAQKAGYYDSQELVIEESFYHEQMSKPYDPAHDYFMEHEFVLIKAQSPDFMISTSPSSRTVFPGEEATFQIELRELQGFNSPVSLSLSGLPTGVTYAFSSSQATPPAVVWLTLQVESDAAKGVFDLSVHSQSSALEHTSKTELGIVSSMIHRLSLIKAGNGIVTSTPFGIDCGDRCDQDYNEGMLVILSAVPEIGWSFSGWGGACLGTGECQVAMLTDQTVTARFDPQSTSTHTLIVSKTGSGTVTSSPSGINCGTDCSESYVVGTPVTLSATPGTGWAFAGWGGACSDTGGCSVTMDMDKRVTAQFVLPDTIIEDFNDGVADNWVDDGSGKWSVSNGRYVMSGNKSGQYRFSLFDETFCDVSFQADMRKVSSNQDYSTCTYGLHLRGDSEHNNYYSIVMAVHGKYMVGKRVGGVFTILSNSAASSAIVPGYGNWNTFLVEAKGTTLKFFANGTLLTTVEDPSLTCGKVGLYVSDCTSSVNTETVQFDNIAITALNSLGKPTLIAPQGSISTNMPTYTWHAVSDSTSYLLHVENSTGDEIDHWYTAAQAGCSSGTGTCSVTAATALAAGAYTWWIQTANDYGSGPQSDTLSFTVTLTKHTIAATAGDHGSIIPSGVIEVDHGLDQTFTITPAAKYHVADVLVDGVSVGARALYKFTNVTTDHTISAGFAIDPQVTITSPNGGEAWYAGTRQTIQWTYMGDAGTMVKINLLKAGKVVKTLTPTTPIGTDGKGSFGWSIPVGQTPGDDYKIKIVSTTKSSCADLSDNVFSIKPPQAITVAAPNGGESWKVASKHTLRWKYTVDIGPTVKVELLKGDSVAKIIASNAVSGISGTGSLPWTVPKDLAYVNEYRLRVTSNTNASCTDTSDKTFTVSGPTLDVTAPDGGESWSNGSNQKITWTYTGNPGGKVKIQLLKAGVRVRTLSSGTSIGSDGKGTFPWVVPNDLKVGSNYRVKISHTSISGCTAISSADFGISKAAASASAGPDQQVRDSAEVRLSAANSTGFDKSRAAFSWVQLDGPRAKLSNPAVIEPLFTAKKANSNGDSLLFQLTVTGENGYPSQDFCLVNVTDGNTPPTAEAGPTQTVTSGQQVMLDGSNSLDLDDGIADYSWKQIEGTQVGLSDPISAQPTFTAPDVEVMGEALVFELTVTDAVGMRARDRCIVNVSSTRNPPKADAGEDFVVPPEAEVTLDGSKSIDPDGDVLSYRWSQLAGQPVILSDPTADQTSFIAPSSGSEPAELVFQLLVTDSGGLQDKQKVVVRIAGALRPVSNPTLSD